MISRHLRRHLLSPTELHITCAVMGLLGSIAIIFPEIGPEDAEESTQHYAGILLTAAFCISFTALCASAAVHMLKLNNMKAFMQLLKWGAVWGGVSAAFCFIAVLADVAPPQDTAENTAVQTSDTLHPATDALNGPSSLLISIHPQDESADTVAATPNLSLLETEHGDVLKTYLELSPRWSGKQEDDSFYAKPGHLVMMPPPNGGAQSLVHVCFRRLVEGDPLPSGYTVVKPGAPFPEDKEQTDDLAVDLGRNHYLLLAWRGSAHKETARKALNAAISAVDARMQPLAEAPNISTIGRMLAGRGSYPGSIPEIRLCEPPSQEGTYQAEIYANPGAPGTLLLYIKDTESGKTLRLLNCQAQYSANKDELFRHDIPGSVPEWARSNGKNEINTLFPERTPLFAIMPGKSHQYFGAAFEVWFQPTGKNAAPRLILRRCYKVQPYEAPAAPVPRKEEEKQPAPEPTAAEQAES